MGKKKEKGEGLGEAIRHMFDQEGLTKDQVEERVIEQV